MLGCRSLHFCCVLTGGGASGFQKLALACSAWGSTPLPPPPSWTISILDRARLGLRRGDGLVLYCEKHSKVV